MWKDILKYKKIIIGMLVLSMVLVSCDKDPKEIEPAKKEDATLTFKFTSSRGAEGINYDTDRIITTSKDTITPKKLKIIFSNVRIIKQNDTELSFPGKYGFISFSDNITDFVLPELPVGMYKGIKFTIGLDSAENFGDPSRWPASHPLNPLYNGLHWSWQGGYIFMSHEGAYKNNGVDDSYTFHFATMPFRNEISLPMSYVHTAGVSDVIEINCDLEKYFDGLNAYSLQSDIPGSHSNSADAKYINKLRENVRQMFSVKM